jgi:hypothetical protein
MAEFSISGDMGGVNAEEAAAECDAVGGDV